jgi:hypothetical protein
MCVKCEQISRSVFFFVAKYITIGMANLSLDVGFQFSKGLDGAVGYALLTSEITQRGVLTSFTAIFTQSFPISLQIWRPLNLSEASTNVFELVFEKTLTPSLNQTYSMLEVCINAVEVCKNTLQFIENSFRYLYRSSIVVQKCIFLGICGFL